MRPLPRYRRPLRCPRLSVRVEMCQRLVLTGRIEIGKGRPVAAPVESLDALPVDLS